MNLKQLKYVLVLSEEGSFSKAAERLNISQPSLSQYIKNIEKQIGADLFYRANGFVRLTDAGNIYIDAGKKILALEHQMENQLEDISSYKGGTVKIGISPYRSVHMMPKVLTEFNKLYPDMELIVKEKSGNELIDAAVHGEFDLCVIALPVDEKIFNCELLQNEEVVIAVNKKTSLYKLLSENSVKDNTKKFPAVDIHLINGYDFAVLSENMQMRIVTDNILKTYGIEVNKKIELSSNEALLSIVNSGVCASLVPSGLIDGLSENIGVFSTKQHSESRDIGIIYRKDQYISKPIAELIKIFKAVS